MKNEVHMKEFDAQLWRDRVVGRKNRAIDNCYPVKGVETEYQRNLLAIADIEATNKWARARNVKIFFTRMTSGIYHIGLKMVSISSTMAPVSQSIVLLHELGHYLVGHDEDHDRFGQGYPQQNIPSSHHNFRHRLACVEEEMEAWARGWKLAKRLQLKCTRTEYDEIRVKCLKSYMKWGINPGPRLSADE